MVDRSPEGIIRFKLWHHSLGINKVVGEEIEVRSNLEPCTLHIPSFSRCIHDLVVFNEKLFEF